MIIFNLFNLNLKDLLLLICSHLCTKIYLSINVKKKFVLHFINFITYF